jgi:8-oxo-dGTP pyrophosphatase MutT (NUDIX family)
MVPFCLARRPPTTNGGQIYFPAGTPDPSDLFDGKVDLEASACRELLEETGVRAEEAIIGATWTVVFAGSRIACIKLMTLPLTADKAKARIEVLLARGARPAFRPSKRRSLDVALLSTLCCPSRLGLLPCRKREKAVLG